MIIIDIILNYDLIHHYHIDSIHNQINLIKKLFFLPFIILFSFIYYSYFLLFIILFLL